MTLPVILPAVVNANVGVANLPNQMHRVVSRKGSNYTIMVVGSFSIR